MRHGRIDDINLPPLELRMGGENFRSDSAFLAGGDRDRERLEQFAGLDADSRLLDLGSGSGRLAISIARRYGCIDRYVGVEVQPRHVMWASRNLPRCFEFVRSDAPNERYNPGGTEKRAIEVEPGFTIAYAYSVFSHMTSADVVTYLKEFERLLEPGGTAWFTAFVEDGVDREVENPEGYGYHVHPGALHVVRFDRAYFDGLVVRAGFTIADFEHGSDTNGQSMYVVKKP
jgi:cyclopropane fatty-acyl-phospholipid synthase-like methyltransferase